VPYIQMFQAGLAPEGRPVGVFLLLGPTGTGKTKTVEALAEVLHGSEKNVLKVDCGEFQMEHEVAKLIGAPPGYLGHRETQPMLTQQKLNAVTSEKCSLSLVLFDEIEKAAPSMTRLLMGVLDKGVLRLGDNTTVNFEKSLVFLTSNLGAREMMHEINPEFGFQSVKAAERKDLTGKLQNIALVSVRKRFSPEFVNRIDCIITYQPLTRNRFRPSSTTTWPTCKTTSTRGSATALSPGGALEARQFLLREGHQRGVRRARAEPHHPPLPHPAAGHAGGHRPGQPGRQSAGGSCRGRRQAELAVARIRRPPPAGAPHRAAGGRQPRPAALSGAPDGRCRLDPAHRRIGHRSQEPDAGAQAQRRAAGLHAARRQRRRAGRGVPAVRAARCW
jgi:energy-coupling factor transporter ATP-binding protein EcfA2